jgi:hypothetical protein
MKKLIKWLPQMMVFILVTVSFPLLAQVKYVISPGSELKVDGGSSLHDWHMASSDATGQGQFVLDAGKLKGIQSLQVELVAETLKSGTKGLDSNAYKALGTGKNPKIKFVLKDLTGSGSDFTAKGDLTIAGVTKPVSFPVKVTQTGNKFSFKGSYDTKLTHFSIDPPTALLGTVKTRDEITITFNTSFQPSN